MANSKEEFYLESAEHMFVQQNMTREEIARKLGLGEKTVRNWAQKYDWEKKRAALREAVTATHLEVYEVIRKVAYAIRMDLEAGVEVSKQRFDSLKNLINSVGGLKKYEDAVTVEKEEKEKKAAEGDAGAAVARINELFGLA